MHSESIKINALVKITLSALFAWCNSIILVFAEYCGWLYFRGYQFSWIERKWHISGVQNSGPYYFPSLFIQKITTVIHGYWNSWIEPSMKTTKTGTPRKLSHTQYVSSISLIERNDLLTDGQVNWQTNGQTEGQADCRITAYGP